MAVKKHFNQHLLASLLVLEDRLMPYSTFVGDTTTFPSRAAVKLEFQENGESFIGSGIMIDRYHVLTAGHCIKTDGAFHTNFKITPAMNNNGTYAPYSFAHGSWLWVANGNLSSSSGSPGNGDIGVITLDRCIGDATGWVGMEWGGSNSYYSNMYVEKYSYPGSPYNGTNQLKNAGYLSYADNGVFSNTAYVSWTTSEMTAIGGESGAGILHYSNGSYYCIGVHTRGGSGLGSAERMTDSIHSQIATELAANPVPLQSTYTNVSVLSGNLQVGVPASFSAQTNVSVFDGWMETPDAYPSIYVDGVNVTLGGYTGYGQANSSGQYVFTTPGVHSVTAIYGGDDGVQSSQAFTQYVNVTGSNQPPYITPVADVAVDFHQTGFTTFAVTDAESSVFTLNASASAGAGVYCVVQRSNFDPSQWAIGLYPPPGWSGTTPVTISASDPNGNITTRTFNFTVRGNVAPSISTDSQAVAHQGEIVQVFVGVSDFESPASTIGLQVSSGLPGLSASVQPTSTPGLWVLSIQGPSGFVGSTPVTLTASDPDGGTSTTSLTFTQLANTPPSLAAADSITAHQGQTVQTFVTVSDAETPAGLIGFQATGTLDDLVITTQPGPLAGQWIVSLLAPLGFIGQTQVTLAASDGGGLSTVAWLTLNVLPNTPPVVAAADQTGSFGQTVAVPITFDDADSGPATLILSATSSVAGMTAAVVRDPIVPGHGTVLLTPPRGWVGTADVTITALDPYGASTEQIVHLTVPAPPRYHQHAFAVGGEAGGAVQFQVLPAQPNAPFLTLHPFGSSFQGSVRPAVADFNGDGVDDFAVASGPGLAGQVLVIDGVSQKTTFSIVPFGSTFTRGISVAAGDLNADGLADLVITAERGGGARMRVFQSSDTGFQQRADFIGLIGGDGQADFKFRGGSRAAVADINGDGVGDLIFAAGAGGGPRMATFNGALLGLNGGPKLTGDFFALSSKLRDGAYVAAGDFDGDHIQDLVVGGGSGAGPQVIIYSGAALQTNRLVMLANFMFDDPGTRGGVRVAVHDLDADGRDDLILGSAPGAGTHVLALSGQQLPPAVGQPLADYSLGFDSLYGVFVG